MKGIIMSAVIGASLVAGTACLATENNPFGLVYENAITENIAGKVNIHPVTYKLRRWIFCSLKIFEIPCMPIRWRNAVMLNV